MGSTSSVVSQQVEQGHGHRNPQRLGNGLVKIGVREKLGVVRKARANLRLKRQPEAVQERIDEQPKHQCHGRQDQQRDAVPAVGAQPHANSDAII
jgi:hypothetical protein